MDGRALLVIAMAGCKGSAPAAPADAAPDSFQLAAPAGLVAWFDLDDSHASHDGGYFMYTGGPFAGFFGDGYHGRGVYLDGVSDYGLVDAQSESERNLDFPGGFTVAMWVRPERTPTDLEVIASRSYGSGDDSSFALAIDSSMRLVYDSQGDAMLVGATPLAVDRWSFVALTYDGTTKRIFLGGALDASGPAAGPVTWDHEYLLFGADEVASPTNARHHLRGSLDDVMLFDRALDTTEIAALAAQ